MSRLLARIMLAILMLPLGGAIYLFTAVMLHDLSGWSLNDETVFMAGNVITTTFLALYWTALWRGSIRWDRRRVRGTALAVGSAGGCGILVRLTGDVVDDGFGVFIGGVIFMLTGLAFVTIAWRERPDERARRATGSSHGGVACPTCGYNMTGLRESSCPECGARFTLDGLLSRQAAHEQGELSSAE